MRTSAGRSFSDPTPVTGSRGRLLSTPKALGHVVELWRYPVKGLRGESLERLALDERGVAGDRRYAVVGLDGKFGSAKTTRRFRRMPGLLTMVGRTGNDETVVIEHPGWTGPVDDCDVAAAVSSVVGEPVTIDLEGDVPHFDAGAVHLLTTASMEWLAKRLPGVAVDARRFRPNVVIASDAFGLVEESWLGAEITVGDARLQVERRVERCVTVALPQDDLPFEPSIARELEEANDFCLGVYASVVAPGTLRVGDAVARH